MAGYKCNKIDEALTKVTSIMNKYKSDKTIYHDLDEVFRLGTIHGRCLQSFEDASSIAKNQVSLFKLKV